MRGKKHEQWFNSESKRVNFPVVLKVVKASWFGSGKRGVLHGIKRASSVKVKDIQPEGRIWAIVDAIPDALEQLAAKMMYLTGMRPYKELLKLRVKDI